MQVNLSVKAQSTDKILISWDEKCNLLQVGKSPWVELYTVHVIYINFITDFESLFVTCIVVHKSYVSLSFLLIVSAHVCLSRQYYTYI